jgi:hypothetical protein
VKGLAGVADHEEKEEEGNEGGDDHEEQTAHESTKMAHVPNLQVRGKWLPKPTCCLQLFIDLYMWRLSGNFIYNTYSGNNH